MVPPAPIFEFSYYKSVASLEAPLAAPGYVLEVLADDCDSGRAYLVYEVIIRGKLRRVSVPARGLNGIQERISQLLLPADVASPSQAHGYIRGRSTLTNARVHAGATYLQKFDIASFFDTVTVEMIESSLADCGFGDAAATLLARLVSCTGILPLGSRSSPRVSNIVLRDLDDHLQAIADASQLRYTRYADDLTFSGGAIFDVASEVDAAVEAAGFHLNGAKTKSFKRGQPMYVTGLSVEDELPRVRSRLKRSLRVEFYFVEKYGVSGHASRRGLSPRSVAGRIMGQFHYVRAIEPAFASKLAAKYPKAHSQLIPTSGPRGPAEVMARRIHFVQRVRALPTRQLPRYAPLTPLQ